jgi:hypothetical protein
MGTPECICGKPRTWIQFIGRSAAVTCDEVQRSNETPWARVSNRRASCDCSQNLVRQLVECWECERS